MLNNVHREMKEESGGGEADAKFPSVKCIPCVQRSAHGMVGERSIQGEVRAEALVDCIRVRMPE